MTMTITFYEDLDFEMLSLPSTFDILMNSIAVIGTATGFQSQDDIGGLDFDVDGSFFSYYEEFQVIQRVTGGAVDRIEVRNHGSDTLQYVMEFDSPLNFTGLSSAYWTSVDLGLPASVFNNALQNRVFDRRIEIVVDNSYDGDGLEDSLAGIFDSNFYQGVARIDLSATDANSSNSWEGTSQRDNYIGGAGTDDFRGRGGDDIIYGNAGRDTLDGEEGSDRVFGGDGADVISGGDENDVLRGGKGRDFVIGGDGDDTMFGGRHSDLMWGGPGDDTVSGRQGADTFIFTAGDAGVTTVTDFAIGQDMIAFVAINENAGEGESPITDNAMNVGLNFAQQGADTLITYTVDNVAGSAQMLVENTNSAALQAWLGGAGSVDANGVLTFITDYFDLI